MPLDRRQPPADPSEWAARLEAALDQFPAGADAAVQGAVGALRELAAEAATALASQVRHYRVMATLQRLHRNLVTERYSRRLGQRACEILCDEGVYQSAWLARFDETETQVLAVDGAGHGVELAPIAEHLRATFGVPQCVAAARSATMAVRLADQPEFANCPLLLQHADSAILLRRLHHAGRTYGVICVALPAGCAGDHEEEALLAGLADDLALELHHQALFESLQHAERALAQAESLVPVGQWIVDTTFQAVSIPAATRRIFGLGDGPLAPFELSSLVVEPPQEVFLGALRKLIDEGEPYDQQLVIRRRSDGAVRQLRSRAEYDAERGLIFGTIRDVTGQHEGQQRAREREQYLETILQASSNGFLVLDSDGQVREANVAYSRLSGYSAAELRQLSILDLDVTETGAQFGFNARHIIAEGNAVFETAHRRKDGTLWPVEVSIGYHPGEGGRFICFYRDLSERQARDAQISLLGQILDEAPICVMILERSGRMLYTNQAAVAMHGYTDRADLLAVPLQELTLTEDPEEIQAHFDLIERLGESHFEVEHRRANGSPLPLDIRVRPIRWAGRPAFVVIGASLTERYAAEAALRQSEAHLQSIFRVAPVGIGVVENRVFTAVNDQFSAITGYPAEELLGRTREILYRSPEAFQEYDPQTSGLVPAEGVWNTEVPSQTRDGRPIELLCSSTLLDPQMSDGPLIFTALDITERKTTEALLRSERARQERMLANIDDVIVIINRQGITEYKSPNVERLFGWPAGELTGQPALAHVHPEDRSTVRAAMIRLLRSPRATTHLELRYARSSGEYRWIALTAINLCNEPEINGILGNFHDITERREAREESDRLQAQLAQAQRLESVGRLAGGVAHDFNNMLGVIIGHADLLLVDLPENHPGVEGVNEIRRAAARSAALTRQLLTFARRQTVAPRDLGLNETIEPMLKLLQRMIGEEIELVWQPGPDLPSIQMDPTQIDQIMANLTINARDAIGRQMGRVTIATDRVDIPAAARPAGLAEGEYVLLTVTDSGCGMDEATRSMIFEPFFTTKPVGEGTGLGLATVFGIMSQNGGAIEVESAPGQGTTFRLYFRGSGPRPVPIDEPESRPQIAAGSETILLVEDEPSILELATTILRRAGYQVLPARLPHEALHLATSHPGAIDLLVTDVIMPGMNGRDLADQLLITRPRLKCLFMSGYTADLLPPRGVLRQDTELLHKPFHGETLARRCRELLDRP